MSFRHHHHYQQPAEYVEEYAREEDRVYGGPPRVNPYSYENTNYQRNERLGELGAVAAGAFAVYEGHEAKVDPQNARMHKYEEEAAAVGGLASAGYAYHEHREKKKYENDRW